MRGRVEAKIRDEDEESRRAKKTGRTILSPGAKKHGSREALREEDDGLTATLRSVACCQGIITFLRRKQSRCRAVSKLNKCNSEIARDPR